VKNIYKFITEFVIARRVSAAVSPRFEQMYLLRGMCVTIMIAKTSLKVNANSAKRSTTVVKSISTKTGKPIKHSALQRLSTQRRNCENTDRKKRSGKQYLFPAPAADEAVAPIAAALVWQPSHIAAFAALAAVFAALVAMAVIIVHLREQCSLKRY